MLTLNLKQYTYQLIYTTVYIAYLIYIYFMGLTGTILSDYVYCILQGVFLFFQGYYSVTVNLVTVTINVPYQ